MKLSTETNYALRALTALARHEPGSIVESSDLSRQSDVPAGFLSKILQRLARAGLVRGHRGRERGYALAMPSERISVRAVAEALDGPEIARRCIFWTTACSDRAPCALHDIWADVRPVLWRKLEAVSVADLAARRKATRKVARAPLNSKQPLRFTK